MKKDEILKQAKLSRISLTESEEKKYTEQINMVLEWEYQIKSIDTSVCQEHNKYHLFTFDDGETIENHHVLGNANSEHNYFVVPKVIESS